MAHFNATEAPARWSGTGLGNTGGDGGWIKLRFVPEVAFKGDDRVSTQGLGGKSTRHYSSFEVGNFKRASCVL